MSTTDASTRSCSRLAVTKFEGGAILLIAMAADDGNHDSANWPTSARAAYPCRRKSPNGRAMRVLKPLHR
jgi:hypothetical protein